MKLNSKVFAILSIFAIISILIIMKCYYFENIDFIKNVVIISGKDEELFIDISIGYIVSYIFYIMQIYIPEKIKKIKFQKNNEQSISGIINDIKELVICIENFYHIQKEGDIQILSQKNIVVKLLNENTTNCCWCTRFYKSDLLEKHNLFDNIANKINKVKDTILLQYMDIEFIELLEKVQQEIICIKKIIQSTEKNNQIQNISKELYANLDELKKNLLKFNKYIKVEKNNYQVANFEEMKKFETMIQEKQDIIKQPENSKLYLKIDFEVESIV